MPRPIMALVGIVLLLALVPTAAGAQAAAKEEVPATATRTVGTQLVGAFTTQGPFNPTAPDHLWFEIGRASCRERV